jgi:signal transduction histidine kinase
MEQTFVHALHLKNISFINRAYPGQGVLADENHLKVVLRNLISNAIKFTSQKGRITLFTTIENSGMVIGIEDNGKGMTSDELDKLFHADTHFSNSGTMGEMGAGIGLLLCKELIELNGGKLEAESTVGKGSKFYFKLPLVKAYA